MHSSFALTVRYYQSTTDISRVKLKNKTPCFLYEAKQYFSSRAVGSIPCGGEENGMGYGTNRSAEGLAMMESKGE
jgi:hypothetical protein